MIYLFNIISISIFYFFYNYFSHFYSFFIFNVKGDESLSLLEINSAIAIINDQISEDANVIFGTVIDNNMKDDVSVTIIATGVEETIEVK